MPRGFPKERRNTTSLKKIPPGSLSSILPSLNHSIPIGSDKVTVHPASPLPTRQNNIPTPSEGNLSGALVFFWGPARIGTHPIPSAVHSSLPAGIMATWAHACAPQVAPPADHRPERTLPPRRSPLQLAPLAQDMLLDTARGSDGAFPHRQMSPPSTAPIPVTPQIPEDAIDHERE